MGPNVYPKKRSRGGSPGGGPGGGGGGGGGAGGEGGGGGSQDHLKKPERATNPKRKLKGLKCVYINWIVKVIWKIRGELYIFPRRGNAARASEACVGWVGGRVGGWVGRWVGGWVDGCMGGWVDRGAG